MNAITPRDALCDEIDRHERMLEAAWVEVEQTMTEVVKLRCRLHAMDRREAAR